MRSAQQQGNTRGAPRLAARRQRRGHGNGRRTHGKTRQLGGQADQTRDTFKIVVQRAKSSLMAGLAWPGGPHRAAGMAARHEQGLRPAGGRYALQGWDVASRDEGGRKETAGLSWLH